MPFWRKLSLAAALTAGEIRGAALPVDGARLAR